MEAICRVTCATWPQGTNLPTPAMHFFMCFAQKLLVLMKLSALREVWES